MSACEISIASCLEQVIIQYPDVNFYDFKLIFKKLFRFVSQLQELVSKLEAIKEPSTGTGPVTPMIIVFSPAICIV